jgi:quinolinate synthase
MMEEISRLKEDLGAVILAHNYQPGPVQVLADLVGDSLELSRTAARLDCQVIIFCGVDFMAETAAILSPDKRVILPAAEAWCPMASMIAAEDLRDIKSAYPEAAVVCYVNSPPRRRRSPTSAAPRPTGWRWSPPWRRMR